MIVEEIIIFAFSVFKQIERNDKFSPCKICRFFCPGGIIFFFRPKIVCIHFCFNFIIRSRIRRNEKILTTIVFWTCSYHQMIAFQFLVVSLKSSKVKCMRPSSMATSSTQFSSPMSAQWSKEVKNIAQQSKVHLLQDVGRHRRSDECAAFGGLQSSCSRALPGGEY